MHRKLFIIAVINFIFINHSIGQTMKTERVFYNGKIYSVDGNFSIYNAMVVSNGTILKMGGNELLDNYKTAEKINLRGKSVYPGFIDAHCHFYGYGVDLKKISLVGTNSWPAVLYKQ